MKNKSLIVSIIIILAVIGVVLLYGNKAKAPSATNVSTGDVTTLPAYYESVTEEQFKQNLLGKDDVIVVDVRTPQEYVQGTIVEKPLNIDFYKDDFKQKLDELDKSKIYFIYCRTGHRTRETKKIMRELGFEKVYDLKGGITHWTGKTFLHINRDEVVSGFVGKPSFIAITGTYCPHCQKALPKLKSDVYDVIGDKINVLVNVLDGESGNRFNVDIPQDYRPELTYKVLTGLDCDVVPSWVVLDANGVVIEKSCGVEKTLDDAVKALSSAVNE